MGKKKILTLFSAPNYCGEYNNFAGCLTVNEEMKCQLKQLEKSEVVKNKIKRSVTPLPFSPDKMGSQTDLKRSQKGKRISRTRTPTKMVLQDKTNKND